MTDIQTIPLEKLYVDTRYQRPLDKNRVAQIVQDFDPRMLGVLTVSNRRNSKYAIFDGQHRFAVLNELEHTEVPCEIHEGLDAQQEAMLFVRLQTERKPIQAAYRHRAAVFAGDEFAMKVDNLVTGLGYSIKLGDFHGSLSCVTAIYRAYASYGPEALTDALTFIANVWGMNDYTSRMAPMVRGTALFFDTYQNEVNVEQLQKRLEKHSSASVLREAHSFGIKAAGYVLVARALVEIYNRGRLETKRGDPTKPNEHRLSPNKLLRKARQHVE